MNTISLSNGGVQTVITPQQVVYLDFDGANTAYRGELLTIEGVTVQNSGLTAAQIAALTDQLNESYWGNVRFVTERPESGDYSTVYVGATDAFTYHGLAETIDEGNQNHSDNAFVNLRGDESLATIQQIISHEVDHLLGTLDHGGDGLAAYGYRYDVSSGVTSTSIGLGGGDSMCVSSGGLVKYALDLFKHCQIGAIHVLIVGNRGFLMTKIMFVFGFLLVCAFLSAIELKQEYCYILFPVDSQPLKKIDMCISYQSQDMAKIPLNTDGVTINADEYACYNAVFNAIKNNSVDGMKPFIYEPTEAKEKQITGILKFCNKYWSNISKNATPELIKIIHYGDSKAFFIRCRNPDTLTFSVLYIPVQTVNGQDFFVDAPDEMNPPFLSIITYNLMAGENFCQDINTYQYRYPIVSGNNSVILHFNGKAESVDLTKAEKQDSLPLTFAQRAFESLSKDYNCYPDFYSEASAERILKSINANPKTKDGLENAVRNYTKISFIIDAQPIYILFYEFPAVKGKEINYVLDNEDNNYRFVNFSSYNPVSEIISTLNKDFIPQTLKK